MKKVSRAVVIVLIAISISVISSFSVYAQTNTGSTSYTVTLSINGDKVVSQDAYLPSSTFLNLGLNNPQDLYVEDDTMYVADTGSKRVVRVELNSNLVTEIGVGILEEPRGVSADKDGNIYVADAGTNKAYRFNKDGSLDFTFEKPTSPAFGKTSGYKPVKIAPAVAGGAYIISEGANAGLLYLNGEGEFLGYFASNEVEMSIIEKIIDSVLTEQQKSMFFKLSPPSFGNLFRGDDGLVYTINMGRNARIKKHSINGLNMFSKIRSMPQINEPADIHVTKDGRMFIVDMAGIITEVTPDGYLLCAFGGSDRGADTAGLFNTPSGIGVDSKNNIYVLDKDKNNISVFSPTPVQNSIHKSMEYYQQGLYDQSQQELQTVLKLNNTSFFGHVYSAKNSMQTGDYEGAAEHFKIANVKEDYSDAYWEIRNIWLQNNLVWIILLLVLIYAAYAIIKAVDKKNHMLAPVRKAIKTATDNKFIYDVKRMGYSLMHPMDNAYDVKVGTVGSYNIATTIYIVMFILLVLYQVATGFIFAVDITEYSVLNVFAVCFSLLTLFLVGNYLISSINDGRGNFRSIYINMAYSMSPLLLFMPILIIVSNFATSDEKFFIDTAVLILLAWSLINAFVGLLEIHDYTFGGVVKNVLLTLAFIGIAILALSVGYLLIKQIFMFVYEIFVEVRLRV